jgi:hypothetical protein
LSFSWAANWVVIYFGTYVVVRYSAVNLIVNLLNVWKVNLMLRDASDILNPIKLFYKINPIKLNPIKLFYARYFKGYKIL